jgi:hypothetical protein
MNVGTGVVIVGQKKTNASKFNKRIEPPTRVGGTCLSQYLHGTKTMPIETHENISRAACAMTPNMRNVPTMMRRTTEL